MLEERLRNFSLGLMEHIVLASIQYVLWQLAWFCGHCVHTVTVYNS